MITRVVRRRQQVMTPDERTVWLHEHMVQMRIAAEIGRIFQRLNYFLVASSFLLGAFATVAVDRYGAVALQGQRGTLAWLIVGAGALLSLFFWVMNTWNTNFAYRFSEWAKRYGPLGRRTYNDLTSLTAQARHIERVFVHLLYLDTRRLISSLCDIFYPIRPAWFARYIPLVFLGVWCGVGAACWSKTSEVNWAIVALPIAIAFLVGIVAFVDP